MVATVFFFKLFLVVYRLTGELIKGFDFLSTTEMVLFQVRGRSAADCANAIVRMHESVFREYKTFYMLYPIQRRWKLKTKQQHFQASRQKKGNRFVCK